RTRWALSPRNLVVHPSGRLTIVDLGLARVLGPAERLKLFDAGYEEAARQRDGRAADLVGLGLLARELLTGQPPDRSAGLLGSGAGRAAETILEEHLADPSRPGYASGVALVTALRVAVERVEPAPASDGSTPGGPASPSDGVFYERPTPRPGSPELQIVLDD